MIIVCLIGNINLINVYVGAQAVRSPGASSHLTGTCSALSLPLTPS